MRLIIAVAPALAALALAGCKDANTPQTQAEMKQEIASLPKPKPGLYRLETKLIKLEMPGIPAAKQEQLKQLFEQQAGREVCLTKAEADKGYEELTKQLGQGKCSFEKFDVDGDKLDAKLVCTSGKDMKAEVGMTGELSSEGSRITTSLKQSQGSMVSEAIMTRTGDCPGA